MIWLVAGLAAAHPFGGRFIAHELRLRIEDDAVVLDHRAEVPDALPGDGLERELASGLVIVADGRALRPERIPVDPVPGSDHTLRVGVTLRADLPPGVRRIEASNGNLPDMPAYHATLVTVGRAWDVTGTSLWTATGDENGEWALGEERRRVVVELEERGAWWAAVSGRKHLVEVGEARKLAWWEPLVRRGGTPETAWMAVIAAAIFGTGRRWWLAGVVAIAGMQPWLLAAHTLVAGALGAWLGRGSGVVRWIVGVAVAAVGVVRIFG